MMQIVQELCKRPGLNKTGFDMPTIYVPNPNKQVMIDQSQCSYVYTDQSELSIILTDQLQPS